jgi:hypothetical protein
MLPSRTRAYGAPLHDTMFICRQAAGAGWFELNKLVRTNLKIRGRDTSELVPEGMNLAHMFILYLLAKMKQDMCKYNFSAHKLS